MAKNVPVVSEKKAPLKINLEDAAVQLERWCEDICNADELDERLTAAFEGASASFNCAVDRRIRFIRYAESQLEMARNMASSWTARARQFQRMVDGLEKNTMGLMKAFPQIPYKGMLGSFKIQRNSKPKLIIDYSVSFHGRSEYLIVRHDLDHDKIRDDLLAGKEVEGAHLEYGEHLRIKNEVKAIDHV